MYNDDEMKQPATKGDLQAVKKDLQAVNEDLQAAVQKLDGKIDRVAKEVIRVQISADATEKKILDRMADFRSDILKVVEDFMGQTGKVDRRQIIIDHRIDRLEKRVDKIESRPRP